MSKSPRSPFWTPATTASKRLVGTHAELVATRGSSDVDTVPTYDRGAVYTLGSRLLHPGFGLGVVVHVPGRGKVRVRFRDQDRLLVAGG